MATSTFKKFENPPGLPRNYPDLHDHLRALDEAGYLMTIDIPINKDTEIHPLMRWQYVGGVEENDRKAMLFTNVIDFCLTSPTFDENQRLFSYSS